MVRNQLFWDTKASDNMDAEKTVLTPRPPLCNLIDGYQVRTIPSLFAKALLHL